MTLRRIGPGMEEMGKEMVNESVRGMVRKARFPARRMMKEPTKRPRGNQGKRRGVTTKWMRSSVVDIDVYGGREPDDCSCITKWLH
eukprot:5543240-Amphidinium_carterae.2